MRETGHWSLGLLEHITRESFGMLMNDLRFAVRALMRSRGFTITAVLTLALGISVNTAIFSVVDSVLLREPPFDEPERIVSVEGQNLGQGLSVASVAYPDVLDWRESALSLIHI